MEGISRFALPENTSDSSILWINSTNIFTGNIKKMEPGAAIAKFEVTYNLCWGEPIF